MPNRSTAVYTTHPVVPPPVTPRHPPVTPRHVVPRFSRPRALAAFELPAFRVYALGQVVTSSGTWIQAITLDWLVLTLTRSAMAVGATAALQFLPALLSGVHGGALVDRLPRRPAVLSAQAANTAVAAVTSVLALTGTITIWQIYALALAGGVVWVIDNPARQVLIADIVPTDRLSSAVSVNASAFQLARIGAPAIAGALITTGGTGFAFAAATTLFAVGLVAWAKACPRNRRGRSGALPRPRAAAGVADPVRARDALVYLCRRPRIGLAIVLVGVVGTFGLNFPIVLTIIAQDMHGDATLYGLFNTMLAIGSVTGALVLAGRTTTRLRNIVLLGGTFGLIQLATALTDTRTAFLALLVLLGMVNLAFQTTANAAVQLWTDPGMRGRVMGVYGQVFAGGTPIGAPIIGAITTQFGGRTGMAVCGIVPLLAAVVLAMLRIGQARSARADSLASSLGAGLRDRHLG